jgi:transcriptional regulator with XRE-family HTH domain
MDVPEELRLARRRARISQRELAQRLGVAPATLARWESGGVAPTVPLFEAALRACGLELVARERHLAEGLTADERRDWLRRWQLRPCDRLREPDVPESICAVLTALSLWPGYDPPIVVGEPAAALWGLTPRSERVVVLAETGALDPTWREALASIDFIERDDYAQIPTAVWRQASSRLPLTTAPHPGMHVVVAGITHLIAEAEAVGDPGRAAQLRTVAQLADGHARLDAAGRRHPAHIDVDEWARYQRSIRPEQMARFGLRGYRAW